MTMMGLFRNLSVFATVKESWRS